MPNRSETPRASFSMNSQGSFALQGSFFPSQTPTPGASFVINIAEEPPEATSPPTTTAPPPSTATSNAPPAGTNPTSILPAEEIALPLQPLFSPIMRFGEVHSRSNSDSDSHKRQRTLLQGSAPELVNSASDSYSDSDSESGSITLVRGVSI